MALSRSPKDPSEPCGVPILIEEYVRASSVSSCSGSGREVELHGKISRVNRLASVSGRVAVLFIVLAGSSFGCGAARRSPFVAPEDATIRIQVDNRNFLDATVHAIWAGGRRRLGTVTGTTTGNFTLRLDRSVLLHFELRLLAGPRCSTRGIWADPGDIIVLEIDPRFVSGPDCLR